MLEKKVKIEKTIEAYQACIRHEEAKLALLNEIIEESKADATMSAVETEAVTAPVAGTETESPAGEPMVIRYGIGASSERKPTTLFSR